MASETVMQRWISAGREAGRAVEQLIHRILGGGAYISEPSRSDLG